MESRILKRYLENAEGKRFIVVTSDGGAYMGVLEDYDGQFIVLHETYESTTATSLMWHKVKLESPVIVNDDVEEKKEELTLERVIINIGHIIRIWPADG